MIRGLIAVTVAVGVCGGAAALAAQVAPQAVPPVAAAPRLPVSAVAAVPVCPGPETLAVPAGGTAVPAPGPVSVDAVGLAGETPPRLSLRPLASGAGRFDAVVPAATVAATPGPTPATGSPAVTAGGITATAAPSARGASPTAATAAPTTATAAAPTTAAAVATPAGPAASPAGESPAWPLRASLALVRPGLAGGLRLDSAADGLVPALSAVQHTLARTGELRGLAAAGCDLARTRIWLVGGGSQLGHRTRILLANPGVTPAVAEVTVFGPSGPVTPAAGSQVLLAPGAQQVLLLDALAPNLTAAAVQVRTRSGRVVATLHDSVVRGLVAGGTDDVGSGAEPSRHLVIPGVVLPARVAGRPDPASPSAPGASAVRIAVPGNSPATVQVRLIGPGGPLDLPGAGVVTVPGGGVRDLLLAGLPAGSYAAVVDADAPVVAAALVGRTLPGGERAGTAAGVAPGVPPSEFAWSPAASPVQGTAVVAVPQLPVAAGAPAVPPSVALSLATADVAVTVQVAEVGQDGAVGAPRPLTLPAGSVLTVPVRPTSHAVVVRTEDAGAGPGAGAVAALVVQVPDPYGPMISVVPVRSAERATARVPLLVADPAQR